MLRIISERSMYIYFQSCTVGYVYVDCLRTAYVIVNYSEIYIKELYKLNYMTQLQNILDINYKYDIQKR